MTVTPIMLCTGILQCCHQLTSCKPKVWTEQPTCRSLINKLIILILHFYDQLNKEKETEQSEVESCIKWVNSIKTCET